MCGPPTCPLAPAICYPHRRLSPHPDAPDPGVMACHSLTRTQADLLVPCPRIISCRNLTRHAGRGGIRTTPCRIASQAFTAPRPEIARPLGHGGRSTEAGYIYGYFLESFHYFNGTSSNQSFLAHHTHIVYTGFQALDQLSYRNLVLILIKHVFQSTTSQQYNRTLQTSCLFISLTTELHKYTGWTKSGLFLELSQLMSEIL